jgi:uncharacterized protein with ParB-like and HNH nuclease domain
MRITPNSLTLGQLFNVSNEQFYIPAYQRRYAWGERQWAALFNDLYFLGENDSHLFGTVLFLTEDYSPNVNTLEIVDGQQRITTLCILLKVILEKFEKDKNNDANEIKKYLSCKDIKENELNKLKLGDLDNPDYKKILKNEELEKVKNEKLKGAYIYFKERIAVLDDVNSFYNKLTNLSSIIRLDISHAKDAYKLFETINNRGLKLGATDIIKNFLLGHASSINKDVLDKVRNNWKDLVISLDGIDMDKFFRHFMMGKLKIKLSESRLIDEFKRYYYININEAKTLSDYALHLEMIKKKINSGMKKDNEEEGDKNNNSDENYHTRETEKFYFGEKMSIIKFSEFLSYSAQVYSKVYKCKFDNDKINKHLKDLRRIKSTPSYTFLLNLFQRNISNKEKIEILKLIKTFMLRRHICEYRTSELDDIFSRLVRIDNINIVENVKKRLSDDLPDDEQFKEKFSISKYNSSLENRAKYILEEIEYKITNSQGEYKIEGGNDVHLEHVIPQTIDTKKSKKEFGDWISYLGDNAIEKHKDYVSRIGNLTLLAGSLNIKASNNPYSSKIKEYLKSNIHLNKELVNDHKDFKFSEVNNRSKNLSNIAVKIWKF